MKKLIVILIASLTLSSAYASRLSVHVHKAEEEQRAQEQREWQQDMNFSDLSFRLDRRYRDDRGQECRDYSFHSRSNPYRFGHYSVCEEMNRHGHY